MQPRMVLHPQSRLAKNASAQQEDLAGRLFIFCLFLPASSFDATTLAELLLSFVKEKMVALQ